MFQNCFDVSLNKTTLFEISFFSCSSTFSWSPQKVFFYLVEYDLSLHVFLQQYIFAVTKKRLFFDGIQFIIHA